MSQSVQTVYSDKHALHGTDQVQFLGYPFYMDEVPARAWKILEAVQEAQLGPVVAPSDYGLEPILAVHDRDFVDFLRTAYDESRSYLEGNGAMFPLTFATRHRGRKPSTFLGRRGYYAFGIYSPILEGTWEAVYWSAQCALTAADQIRQGEQAAYALCRPPGHHAGVDLYDGFCYLNNAAIAARYLQTAGEKVAILDIDYHHGNGTQMIFYDDPSVLFCSLHADPDVAYPYYWGYADEKGEGEAEGTNRNFPLRPGTDDLAYLETVDEALRAIGDFAPDYLIVSLGFDTEVNDPVDPIGGFSITSDGFRRIGERVAGLGLPTVVVQEGGYLLSMLGQNAVAFLRPFTR